MHSKMSTQKMQKLKPSMAHEKFYVCFDIYIYYLALVCLLVSLFECQLFANYN